MTGARPRPMALIHAILCTQAYRHRDTLLLAGDTAYLLFTTKYADTLWLCHGGNSGFIKVSGCSPSQKMYRRVHWSRLHGTSQNSPDGKLLHELSSYSQRFEDSNFCGFESSSPSLHPRTRLAPMTVNKASCWILRIGMQGAVVLYSWFPKTSCRIEWRRPTALGSPPLTSKNITFLVFKLYLTRV